MTERAAETVVGAALQEAASALKEGIARSVGEQLPLLPLLDEPAVELAVPTRFEGEDADRQQQRARRGRPPGAGNRSTRELREFLRRIGYDPLLAMMSWARHTPESLAVELDCKKGEAFDRLMRVHEAIAPYIHAKLQPTDDQGRAVPSLAFLIGGYGAPAAGAPPWQYPGGPVLDGEQNQALAPERDPVSHADVSHEASK